MKLSKLSMLMISAVTLAQINSTKAEVLAPQSAQLVNLAAPSYAIEKKSVHFSQAIRAGVAMFKVSDSFESISDEFWLEVDGETLNQGIQLNINHPEALIRLSAKQSDGQYLPDDHAIDPAQLELRKNRQLIKKAFSQRVSQKQMATASILANSSAVKMSAAAGTGQFQLRVAQSLDSTQKYIVNVKEKGSIYRQSLAIPQQSYIAGGKINFSANMTKQDTPMSNTAHRTYIKNPNGEMTQVNYVSVDNENIDNSYQVSLPAVTKNVPRGQLYELHVRSEVKEGNNTVMRVGKMAFAVAAPTARMKIEGANYSHASVHLEVASEGRYEVSGVVYGQDQSGQAKPLMRSSSAYYLSPGQQTVNLQFDKAILAASTLSKPFELRDAKLTDQSRVSILQRQSSQQKVMLVEEEFEVKSSGGSLSIISLLSLFIFGAIIRRRRVAFH
jgi:hypothetical protein